MATIDWAVDDFHLHWQVGRSQHYLFQKDSETKIQRDLMVVVHALVDDCFLSTLQSKAVLREKKVGVR